MAALLRRAADDDRSFERLYRKHVRDVFRYSLAVLGEPADAEDVTQTTFLNAYRAFKGGVRPEKPENWLIAIAHNVCRQRFRQAQRRPREVELEERDAVAAEADGDGPSAADLRRAFAALPENQRAALAMRELEGRSYADIAEVLGLSVSALETLLFRARRSLREQLEEQITCNEAELAISKQLDGRLDGDGKRALRAHLRACPECARLARSERAQRRVLRGIFAVPLPPSLASFAGLGGSAASTAAVTGGVGLAAKAAAVVAAGAVVGTGAYEGVTHVQPQPRKHPAPAVAPTTTAPAPARAPVVVAPAKPAPARQVAPKPKPKPKPVVVTHAKPKPKPPIAVVRAAPPPARPHVPPGQAKKHERVPPGLATKHGKPKAKPNPKQKREHVPPGQAKKHEAHGREHVPPGQAKKQEKQEKHANHGRGHERAPSAPPAPPEVTIPVRPGPPPDRGDGKGHAPNRPKPGGPEISPPIR